MPEAPQLPELARSLKTIGAVQGVAATTAHDAIFPPLLHARARASHAPIGEVLAALRGDALSARIEACVFDVAVGDLVQPSRVRARTAEASEILKPLRNALIALDEAAIGAEDGGPPWDAWVARLRDVFAAADVACQTLTAMLEQPVPTDPHRLFGGLR